MELIIFSITVSTQVRTAYKQIKKPLLREGLTKRKDKQDYRFWKAFFSYRGIINFQQQFPQLVPKKISTTKGKNLNCRVLSSVVNYTHLKLSVKKDGIVVEL